MTYYNQTHSLSSSVSPISVIGGPIPILVCPNTEHVYLVYGLRSDTSVIVVLVTTMTNKKCTNLKMYSLTVFICCHYNISRWSFTNTGRCTNITE